MTTGSSELTWCKSSYSTNDGPECVEVAVTPRAIHIRDSKNIQGPHLDFTPDHWTAFVAFAVTASSS